MGEEAKDKDWLLEKIKWFLSTSLGQFLSAIALLVLIFQLLNLWTATVANFIKLLVIIGSIAIIYNGFIIFITRKASEFKISYQDIKKIQTINKDIELIKERLKEIEEKIKEKGTQ